MLQAWAIFRAFEKHCRVDSGGYAGLESVLGRAPFKRRDHMESFWLSESLKYLWLLFSDDGADLQLPAPDIVAQTHYFKDMCRCCVRALSHSLGKSSHRHAVTGSLHRVPWQSFRQSCASDCCFSR